jgi:hypothetical protein
MKSVIENARWKAIKGAFDDVLTKAGAEFTIAVSKDAYCSATLETPLNHTNGGLQSFPYCTLEKKIFGIRYVPDTAIMQESIDLLAPITEQLTLSVLPHKVVPDSLSEIIAKHPETEFKRVFEYDNNVYKRAGKEVREKDFDSPYLAGREFTKRLQQAKEKSLLNEPKRKP